jgi:membrane protein
MASLSDAKKVLISVGPLAFARRVWHETDEDYILVWAAALAYSWLFAVFPFLVFLISLIPNLPQRVHSAADSAVSTVIKDVLGKSANLVNHDISDVMDHSHFGLLSAGLLVALWVAGGGMAMTMSALDLCYEIKNGRGFFKRRLIAMILTIVVSILMLRVFFLMPVATALKAWLINTKYVGFELGMGFDIARYGLAVCLMLAMLSFMYRFGPSKRQRFNLLSPGALFTVIVWILVAISFRIYVDGFASYELTYGALSGVALLMLLLYINAAVLLIGAEINSEIDFAVRGKTG